ncbi:DUF86 domain-containing protein [Patescibacteria group bacterium]|nr:DUF86 domain-containing protein [Patescibacteria group bacterium]
MQDYNSKFKNKKQELLKDYFAKRKDVLMAFVFGSWARGQQMLESDFDVGVYFDQKYLPEDEQKRFELEDEIWSDVSRIVEKEVDLVCLNIAPASLVSNVIKTGIPLVIKDKKIYWDIYLKVSLEAEDFLNFAEDYFKISKEAKSLAPEQKEKLLERLQFLNKELREIENFKKLTFSEYKNNSVQRRNIERWAETIINAIIDAAKIVLASEQKFMPRSYEYALLDIAILAGFNREEAEKFSKFAELRNILAHEYLDILYGRLQNFVKEFPPSCQKIFEFLEKYLKENK